jgi:hypothetical protein
METDVAEPDDPQIWLLAEARGSVLLIEPSDYQGCNRINKEEIQDKCAAES